MVKKSIIGVCILTTLLMLPVFSLAIPQVNNSLFLYETPKPSISWDLDSYYNYTGPKINASKYSSLAFPRVYIDEDEPMYNWSAWSSYPWLTGSGTQEDPYVIEKLLIDAQGDGGCVSVYNSTSYFIIRQCYFANTGKNEFDNGITFLHTENGQIYGNIIDHCKCGFFITFRSSNLMIFRNFMRGTKIDPGTMRALYSDAYSHNCTFEKNLISNYEQLAWVSKTDDLTIDGNFMNNTEYKEYPSSVISIITSSNVQFRQNIFTDNYKWFDFDVSQVNCANNTIAGNGVVDSLSGVEIPTPLCIGLPSGLHTAQSSSTIMSLSSTIDSQIVNNYIYQPSDNTIPGFELYMLLAIIGVIGVILTIIMIQKVRKFA